jgi:hypothetical protein
MPLLEVSSSFNSHHSSKGPEVRAGYALTGKAESLVDGFQGDLGLVKARIGRLVQVDAPVAAADAAVES